MENISNSELLYDVIDTLSDEEFKDLLDTLAIDDGKVEDIIEEKTKEVEEPIVEEEEKIVEETIVPSLEDRKKALQERVTAIRNKDKEAVANAAKIKAIQEKLSYMRKKKAIQEKLNAIRNNKTAEAVKDEKQISPELRNKIREKLEVARKKAVIQERVKAIRNNK